jgi:hypothetical protein
MLRLRKRLLVACSFVLLAGNAAAQAPTETGEQRSDQPLRFRLGRVEVAPYIRVGEVALDSNVYFTPEDRKTDLTTSGGPGLRITVPAGRFRLYGDGNVDYYWFLRTKEQRRFGGQAGGGVDWETSRLGAGLSRVFSRTYRRPSIEVDQRVQQDAWSDDAYLSLDLGRVTVLPSYNYVETVAEQVDFLGTDLARTLTQNRRNVTLETLWRLTPKTAFILLGDQEWTRFPKALRRDSDSNRLAGGFQLSSETRLSGRVLGGVRLFRPIGGPGGRASGGRQAKPFADAAFDWRLGAKTSFGARYRYDTTYSAFDTVDGRLPLILNQEAALSFSRRILRRFSLELEGGVTTQRNDGQVIVLQPEERAIERDDRYYRARADFGFFIFERLRFGVVGTYSERQSNFADFGVDGLLVGASLRFNPGASGGDARGGRAPRNSGGAGRP